MRKVILHVGPHKTGSTYIQRLLFESHDSLKSHNVLYPLDFINEVGHHGLKNQLLGAISIPDFDEKIDLIKNFEGDIIFSSENFDKLDQEHLEPLVSLFPDSEFRVVYYYRTPSRRLLSYWHEMVKHGELRSYYEYTYHHIIKPFASQLLNPYNKLRVYQKVFGKDAIRLVHYDQARFSNRTLSDFFVASDLDLLVGEKVLEENKMLDLEKVEVIRQLNALNKKDPGSHSRLPIGILFLIHFDKIKSQYQELKAGMEKEKKEIFVGNWLLDKAIIDFILSEYGQYFINEQKMMPDEKVTIPQENWMEAESSKNLLKEIFDILCDSAKSQN